MNLKLAHMYELRQGSEVDRSHTIRRIRGQTVGQHSFNAILIARFLCHHNGLPHHNVTDYLLIHDLAEMYTGDMPGNVKRIAAVKMQMDKLEEEWWLSMPEYIRPDFELSAMESSICKLSDWIEFMWWCVEERRMGSRLLDVENAFYNVFSYLCEFMQNTGDVVQGANELIYDLKREWDKE